MQHVKRVFKTSWVDNWHLKHREIRVSFGSALLFAYDSDRWPLPWRCRNT